MVAVAAALAVWTGWPACPGRRVWLPHVSTAWLPAAAAVLTTAVVVTAGPRPAAAVGLGATAIVGLVTLWRRRDRRRTAAARATRVLETCELLASELAAGRPPGAALERAAAEWPELAPAAEAWVLGSDVPGALRLLSRSDGAQDLRLLGAAWQVSHRTGQGLAHTVGAIAEDVRAAQATRRVVEAELASARATARLVAALPVPVLMLGGGAGANPWAFLLGSSVGLGCLGLGLAFVVAGLWWIEAIATSVWEPR